MKPFFLMLLLFSFFELKAQQENKANTPTNKANEVTISNGNTSREKVDSVFRGQIIKDKTKNSRIYLTGFQQTVDTSGIYTTTYIFGAKVSKATFDIDINMKFQAPLLSNGIVGFEYGPYGVGRFSGSGGVRNNNLYLFLQGQVTASGHHFFVRVKSKQKPQPVINGTEGQANF